MDDKHNAHCLLHLLQLVNDTLPHDFVKFWRGVSVEIRHVLVIILELFLSSLVISNGLHLLDCQFKDNDIGATAHKHEQYRQRHHTCLPHRSSRDPNSAQPAAQEGSK